MCARKALDATAPCSTVGSMEADSKEVDTLRAEVVLSLGMLLHELLHAVVEAELVGKGIEHLERVDRLLTVVCPEVEIKRVGTRLVEVERYGVYLCAELWERRETKVLLETEARIVEALLEGIGEPHWLSIVGETAKTLAEVNRVGKQRHVVADHECRDHRGVIELAHRVEVLALLDLTACCKLVGKLMVDDVGGIAAAERSSAETVDGELDVGSWRCKEAHREPVVVDKEELVERSGLAFIGKVALEHRQLLLKEMGVLVDEETQRRIGRGAVAADGAGDGIGLSRFFAAPFAA